MKELSTKAFRYINIADELLNQTIWQNFKFTNKEVFHFKIFFLIDLYKSIDSSDLFLIYEILRRELF